MPRQAKVHWHKGKRRWYANIGERDKNGRATEVYAPESIGSKDEPAAWEWLKVELVRRQAVPAMVGGNVTVAWVAEHYLAWAVERKQEGKLPVSEYANKTTHLSIVCGSLGSRAAARLSPDDLTTFAERLLNVYSPVYARNICATTRAALNWAVKQKHLERNPILGFIAPTIPRSPARFAERAEAAVFLSFWRGLARRDTIKGRYQRYTLLLERCLIRTGCRPKELCRLQWTDLAWEGWKTSAGHLCAKGVIPPSRWKAGKVTGKPRTIYFTPLLTRALRRLRDSGPPDETWVFVHGAGKGGAGAAEPWASGSTLSKTICRVRRKLLESQSEIRKSPDKASPWERRLAAVQIKDAGAERLVNYRWRHTAISTLLMMGVDVSTVAELTGTSPDMVYRHYGHLLDSHLQAAAEKLAGKRRK